VTSLQNLLGSADLYAGLVMRCTMHIPCFTSGIFICGWKISSNERGKASVDYGVGFCIVDHKDAYCNHLFLGGSNVD